MLLLNPDTEVYAGTLDAALARLRSEPRIGMVGCKLVLRVRRARPRLQALLPDPAQRPRPLHRRRPRARGPRARSASTGRPTLGDDEPGEVDAVNGAFMLCRAEAIREVGLLDEGYWLYMEDLDWCHRFWDAGWKVFYEPAGVALHVKGGSSGGRRAPRQEIAFHRGMGRFYRRFDAPEHNPLLNAAVYAGVGAKLAVSLGRTAARAGIPAIWEWPVHRSSASEGEGLGYFGELGGAFVALAEQRVGDLPVDPDVGVVPGDAGLGQRVVVAGEQVGDVGDVAEHGEAVAEADRDEELAVLLVVEDVGLPLAVGGRVAAQVDGDVEDRPARAADQLRLARLGLEVDPAQRPLGGARVVVLDELDADAELGPGCRVR